MSGETTSKSKLPHCPWAGNDALYVAYHNHEWGVPKSDDVALFEKLVLEGFQAGLSWITILRKRESFRKAFHGFDAPTIARFKEQDVARLMADAGIVRNKAKIEATINNARAYLALRERISLGAFIWDHVDGIPQINRFVSMTEVPAETETSRRISKSLKSKGFRFVGPTTVYAFMQSTGMVNDHLVACPRHSVCKALQQSFDPPVS